MNDRKDLNAATTRTLRKNLGISVKVCSAINTYRRRKGSFKHIDELWRIPGMTRKVYDQVTEKYFVPGQTPPELGEASAFEWTSLSRSTIFDSRSFPSLKNGWRRLKTASPKPGPSRAIKDEYVVENVRMTRSCSTQPTKNNSNVSKTPSPSKGGRHSPMTQPPQQSLSTPAITGMIPVEFPSKLASQSRLMMPLSVQQSPSGNKLCIIYSCPLQENSSNRGTQTPKKAKSKSSRPSSPGTTRSKSPSILKRSLKGHIKKSSSVSKSQLEEPRNSPTRDKRVGFTMSNPPKDVSKSGSYSPRRQEALSQTLAQSSRVYKEDGGLRTETLMEAYMVQGPSTSRAVESTVASGEKVSEWINSNSDFMKTPEMFGNMVALPDLSSHAKLTDAKDVGKTVARGRIPPMAGSPRKNDQDRLLRHRKKQQEIGVKGSKKQHSPGGATSSTSPNRGELESRQLAKPENTANKRAAMICVEPPRGYTFRRKRYRREKSREKTVVPPKRKRCRYNAKPGDNSSMYCTVI